MARIDDGVVVVDPNLRIPAVGSHAVTTLAVVTDTAHVY